MLSWAHSGWFVTEIPCGTGGGNITIMLKQVNTSIEQMVGGNICQLCYFRNANPCWKLKTHAEPKHWSPFSPWCLKCASLLHSGQVCREPCCLGPSQRWGHGGLAGHVHYPGGRTQAGLGSCHPTGAAGISENMKFWSCSDNWLSSDGLTRRGRRTGP